MEPFFSEDHPVFAVFLFAVLLRSHNDRHKTLHAHLKIGMGAHDHLYGGNCHLWTALRFMHP